MILRDAAAGWLKLGEVAPPLLREMREQLRWVALLVAAVGGHYVARRPDGSELALQWLTGQELLASERPWKGKPFRAAVRVATFSVALLDQMDRPLDEVDLDGRSLGDARAWLEDGIAEFTGEVAVRFELPEIPLPAHPVSRGRVFELESVDACLELARWFAGADVVLEELVAATPNASPVRCWLPRLDLRTRITVRAGDERSDEKAILVGMSPGDDRERDPHWYVQPLPVTAHVDPRPLGHGGSWRTQPEPFAVLPARWILPGSAAGQRERVVAFLEEALASARELLGDE